MINFINLFFEFFKIGLFSVGGGLATIPFLQEMCNKYDWFTPEELSNMIAIGESTPGPIGVNMATYTGFINGMAFGGTPFAWLGGIVATLGIISPAFITIFIVSRILNRFKESPLVESIFKGLRPAVAGLILTATFNIFRVSLFKSFPSPDIFAFILYAILVFTAFKFKKLHPITIVIIGAVLGIVIKGAGL